jgi:PAS domain S-box-containing protein
LADLQAERLSQIVELARGLATAATYMPEVVAGGQACEARLREITQTFPEFVGMGVFGPDGNTTCRSSGGEPIYLGDRPYFEELMREKRFVASGYMIGRAVQRQTIVFVAPSLDREGNVQAGVLVSYAVESISGVLSRRSLPPGASVSLVDAEGRLVARFPIVPNSDELSKSETFTEALREGVRGTVVARGLDGVRRAYGYAPLTEPARFRVVVGVPLAPALAEIDQRLWWSLGLLGAIFILAAITALIGGELGIRRPIRELQRVAGALAAGDLRARPRLDRNAVGELGALAASIDQMASAVAERETALAASEAFSRRILSSSRDCIKVLDLEGRLQSINEYGREVLGIGVDEPVAGLSFAEVWSEEDREAASAAIEEACAGGAGRFQGRYVTKFGREMWWDVAITPMPGAGGRIERLLAISRDVTEAKLAEAQREQLMAELDHRVKNTLAAVQSIASRSLGKSDASKTFMARLSAMAKAHDLLSSSKWEGAELHDLARSVFGAFGHRFHLNGPRVQLNAKVTQVLGLVLHELATNSAKYGALSRPEGKLDIDWRMAPENRRKLRLEWLERDGPRPEAASEPRFGLSFVRRSVEYELGGTVSLDFEPEGLRCVLEIPLASAEAVTDGDAMEMTSSNEHDVADLQGMRVLLVEDSILIAMQMQDVLEESGCIVVGPAATLGDAVGLAETVALDAAVLDVNLGGETVFPAAARLAERGIPFLFTTGYSSRAVFPPEFADADRVGKPVDDRVLAAKLSSTIRKAKARSAAPA